MRSLIYVPLAVLALAACNPLNILKPYRIEIQQGNFVEQAQVAQLKPGMTKDQVRFVLGTPLIADLFHADRWDYVYRLQKSNSNNIEERRLTVFFDGDKLTRVEGDVVPAGQKDTAAGPAAGKQ